jgi:predicted RNA-binding protein YlxR (DUF448 family)
VTERGSDMTQPQPAGPARKRRKGPRSRHVPQRTCVACREKGDKRGLIRIVRSPDHRVSVDSTGKANGRGAYLCHKPSCWERALSTPILARALNTDINADAREKLEKVAATLGDESSSDRTAAAS